MTNDPVTANIESTLDHIMECIGEMSYPEDAPMIRSDARNLLARGWLPNEIVAIERWTEHVDKDIPEDVALRNMAVIESNVAKRLAGLTK